MNIALIEPCPPHRWAYAPTVGTYSCMTCGQRREYNDPQYAEAEREYAKQCERNSAVSDDDERNSGYRVLACGEIVQLGDEVQADDGSWDLAVRSVGSRAPDPAYTSHRVFRRAKLVAPTGNDGGRG